MPVPTTTLQVAFVSESADFRNTFGWYNRATGYGGILFANVEAQGGNAPLTPGVSTANFTVNTADLANIAFFLVSDGYDLNRNDADDFTGAVKVIQLANEPGRSPTSIRTAMSKPTTARRIFSRAKGSTRSSPRPPRTPAMSTTHPRSSDRARPPQR